MKNSRSLSSVFYSRRGQVMLLAVLSMGGIILGATTIAGFLMIHQIRQTTVAEDSARAIFAADAGLERGLYTYFKVYDCFADNPINCPSGEIIETFPTNNGSSYQFTLDTDNATVISRGTTQTTHRIFFLRFLGIL